MKIDNIKEVLFKKYYDFNKPMLNKLTHASVKVINEKYVVVNDVKLLPERVTPTGLLMSLGNKVTNYVDEYGMCPGIVDGVCYVHRKCKEVVGISVNDTFYVKEILVTK